MSGRFTRVGGAGSGFAAMNKAKRSRIASLGGIAAHRKGTAHQWTRAEAKAANKKAQKNAESGPVKVFLLVYELDGKMHVFRVYANEWCAREALAIVRPDPKYGIAQWSIVSCPFVPADAKTLV